MTASKPPREIWAIVNFAFDPPYCSSAFSDHDEAGAELRSIHSRTIGLRYEMARYVLADDAPKKRKKRKAKK